MEFDFECVSKKSQLSYIFYDGLWSLIKLWINEKKRPQLSEDNLISDADKAKAEVHIHDKHNLDQHCLKGKQAFKINLDSWDS